jgi:hypothetical protein
MENHVVIDNKTDKSCVEDRRNTIGIFATNEKVDSANESALVAISAEGEPVFRFQAENVPWCAARCLNNEDTRQLLNDIYVAIEKKKKKKKKKKTAIVFLNQITLI